MSTFLWLLLAFVYILLFVTLALTTLRKGHYFLFWVGIVSPMLWIIGTIMGPTARAEGPKCRLSGDTQVPKSWRVMLVLVTHSHRRLDGLLIDADVRAGLAPAADQRDHHGWVPPIDSNDSSAPILAPISPITRP
jgi:hypothetical protein